MATRLDYYGYKFIDVNGKIIINAIFPDGASGPIMDDVHYKPKLFHSIDEAYAFILENIQYATINYSN